MRKFFVENGTPTAGTRVEAEYVVEKSSMSAQVLEHEKRNLTVTMKSFGGKSKIITCFREDDIFFFTPRFYGLERFGKPEVDKRTDGVGAFQNVQFVGTLSDVQNAAVKSLFNGEFSPEGCGGGILKLPCGKGKTVVSTYVSCLLKRKTFVLVHKKFLRDQWEACFKKFCPGVRIGFVQGDLFQIGDEYDVVIGMVLTLAKRGLPPSTFASFGLLCVDEAHHMAASVMNKVLRSFSSRFVLSLSATFSRCDGLTPLLYWCLGKESFKADRDDEKALVSIALFRSSHLSKLFAKERTITSRSVSKICNDESRNEFIASKISNYLEKGRTLFVLSHRISHLFKIREAAIKKGIDKEVFGIFRGGLKDAERRTQLTKRIVLCTYGMASEGLDKREADTCILSTPRSSITQCVGRVQRPCQFKKQPLVLDIVDEHHPLMKRLRWKRQKQYADSRYNIQVLMHTSNERMWF
jgi:superfamily II DNA or RNA helicase